MRVLVCDDHVVFAESVSHLLASRGIKVVATVHDPREAVAVALREQPDVCLMDVMFGSTSALDAVTELRRCAPHARVVLLTAWLDPALASTARAAGAHGIAQKTQPFDEIVKIMNRVSAGEIVLPEDQPTQQRGPVGRHASGSVQGLARFLTPRERQVLSGLVCGNGTAKLAIGMGITEVTARCHIQSVLTKLGAHSRLEAAALAVRSGMIDPRTGEWLVVA